MDTLTVEFDELMTRFDEIVDRVREGRAVCVHRNGSVDRQYRISITPLADTKPVQKRVFGLKAAGDAWMSEDFNAPLPDSFWMGEQ